MYFWQGKKLFPEEILDLFLWGVVYFDQRLGAVHSKTDENMLLQFFLIF